MANTLERLKVLIIAACLIIILPVNGWAGGTWWRQPLVPNQPEPSQAEKLAAQRKAIEKLKALFDKIGRRFKEIESIHHQIERILHNPDEMALCVALENLEHKQGELKTQIDSAVTDEEKSALEKDMQQYKVIFDKVKATAKQFQCEK